MLSGLLVLNACVHMDPSFSLLTHLQHIRELIPFVYLLYMQGSSLTAI